MTINLQPTINFLKNMPIKFASNQAPQTFIYSMPEEILLNIFKDFKAEDLNAMSKICKDFYVIGNKERVWEALIKKEFKGPVVSLLIEQEKAKKQVFGTERSISFLKLACRSIKAIGLKEKGPASFKTMLELDDITETHSDVMKYLQE
jgi:hypothetical protein